MEFLTKIKQYFRNLKENFFHTATPKDINLIKNSHLFDSLGERSFNQLLKSFKYKTYKKGELILKEGTIGKAFYIIAEGSVSVFTINAHGEKIYLARLDEGNYFGEQSLIGHASKSRNASIEAITDAKLIKIKGKYLKEIISQDNELKTRLIKIGHEQLIHNIIETVPNYDAIKEYFITKLDTIINFKKNDVVFNLNDPADAAYIILEGKIKISLPLSNTLQEIYLNRGDLFGELGIIKRSPRAASAIAAEDSKLLKIDAEQFKELYKISDKFKTLVDTLTQTYILSNRGTAFQFVGQVNDATVITTDFKLQNGRHVIATRSIDKTFIMLEKNNKKLKTYTHQKANGVKIEIGVTDDKHITSVKCWGDWRYLSNVCAFILDQKIVSTEQLKTFEANGKFRSEDVEKSEIVCVCMSVNKSTIEDLIDDGITSLAVISEKTGACTVCGSCRPRILSLLGQDIWMPAVLTKLKDHGNNITSFLVEPTEGLFNAYQPGEHLVIQLQIDGNWVERAYTISDFGKGSNQHRITVKKEEHGLLANWLAANGSSQINIYVSQPQGNFKLIAEESFPVVCFAGGIGITPFITFAKAILQTQPHRAMHLIYIAPTAEEFIFLDEFEELKKVLPNFKLTLWERKKAGYLTDENVSDFIKDYNGANIYICGPEGFETSLIKILKNIDFRSDKIFLEKFTYANPIINVDVTS